MTRNQRRMRSGCVGSPADWSICNSHRLWAVDARVAEPSRRKSALPPGLFVPHALPARHPGISCRGNCRIDCLGCDDAMVACRADRRRKMTHNPSSFFNVPRGGVEHLATYGHRGRTCVSHRPRASFNDSCGRACRHNYLAGAQWTALVHGGRVTSCGYPALRFWAQSFSPHSLFICNGLITALTRSRTHDNDQPMSAVGQIGHSTPSTRCPD
jgi:hypothetical protein